MNGAAVVRRHGTRYDTTARDACDENDGRGTTGGECVVSGNVAS